MKKLSMVIPVLAVLVSLLVLARPLMPTGDAGAYDLDTLGRLPVSAGGRTKPLDSVARNSLMIVSDRQTAVVGGKRISAIHWLMDVMARPEVANDYDVFRIDHPDVRSHIDANDDKQKRFSFNRLQEFGQKLNEQFITAAKVKSGDRTPYQRHVVELRDHVSTYVALLNREAPYSLPPLSEDEQWRPLASELHVPHEGHEMHAELSPAAASLSNILLAYRSQDPAAFNTEVSQYASTLDQRMPGVTRKARFEVFFNKLRPFYQGTVLYVLAFLLGAGSLLAVNVDNGVLAKALGRAAVAVVALTFIVHTFGLAARIYMQGYAPVTNLYSSAVFIGWFCVVMGLFMEWIYKNGLSAVLAAVIGFVTLIIAHNLADGDTMQMMQAVLDSNFWLATHVTAVTIGYSATFMAGCLAILFIAVGIHIQCLSQNRHKVLFTMLFTGVVGVLALATVIAISQDQVMAVLQGFIEHDTWFLIRNVILMPGYVLLFLTMFIGVVYLLTFLPWRPKISELENSLGKMIYGTVAFALLFSFVGTVLGGIWADQSWGRFWGWDPKENGAVLIVLMNALILHARWAGMVKTRGMAVLAVLGNIITAWSWFGTNMLGVGLHSYGFMDKALMWMLIFIASQLAIMTAGMIPLSKWKSYATPRPKADPTAE